MKKITCALSLCAFVGVGGLLADYDVIAVKSDASLKDIKVNSALWDRAVFDYVSLYPQTTISFNDKEAVEINANNKKKRVIVGALYSSSEVAFKISWFDATKSVQTRDESDVYGDGIAIQFPAKVDGSLPYIGMGDEERGVVVHLLKSSEGIQDPKGDGKFELQIDHSNALAFGKDLEEFKTKKELNTKREYAKSFVAKGYRTTTEISNSSFFADMEYDSETSSWSAVIVRPIKDAYTSLDGGAFPVAFGVWDGDRKNRDGLKHISRWNSVKKVGESDKIELSKMTSDRVVGDIENGKKLAIENCAVCHNFQGSNIAPEFMAPNLSNIGGYSTSQYLRESIVDPNKVIVPGYNRNAHKAYPWYTLENGKRVSTMPSYEWMDQKSVDDLVAFLQTLKMEE